MRCEVNVLYTRQKTQKSKTWHDGVVVIDNVKGTNKVSLYRVSEGGHMGELVECYSTYLKDLSIDKIRFPNHLIEANEQSGDEYDRTGAGKPSTAKNPSFSSNKPLKSPLIKVISKDRNEIYKPRQCKKESENSNKNNLLPKVISAFNISSKRNISKALNKLID